MANLHGKSAKVYLDVTHQWKNHSPIFVRVPLKHVYNSDKTSIFFFAILSRSFVQKDKALVGTKVLKEWFTVLLSCSSMGRKEKLCLVGKAKSPYSL